MSGARRTVIQSASVKRVDLEGQSYKRQASSVKLQADNLNADNSARFVKNAKRPV